MAHIPHARGKLATREPLRRHIVAPPSPARSKEQLRLGLCRGCRWSSLLSFTVPTTAAAEQLRRVKQQRHAVLHCYSRPPPPRQRYSWARVLQASWSSSCCPRRRSGCVKIEVSTAAPGLGLQVWLQISCFAWRRPTRRWVARGCPYRGARCWGLCAVRTRVRRTQLLGKGCRAPTTAPERSVTHRTPFYRLARGRAMRPSSSRCRQQQDFDGASCSGQSDGSTQRCLGELSGAGLSC